MIAGGPDTLSGKPDGIIRLTRDCLTEEKQWRELAVTGVG
jgi:hypothetical protein